ncbi:MAG: InlB B-repeat-containing protein, partial [Spirochaetales bacterium]
MDKYGLTRVHHPYAHFIKNALLGLFLVLIGLTSVATGFFGVNTLSNNNAEKIDEVSAVVFYVVPTTSVSPSSSGSISSSGTNPNLTYTATPSGAYVFDHWYIYEDWVDFGVQTSTSISNPLSYTVYTALIMNSCSLTAYFTITTYTLYTYAYTNNAYSATGGTVKAYSASTNADSYDTYSYNRGATATMIATVSSSTYLFDGWYTGSTSGTKVSPSTSYSFIITANTYRYARFYTRQLLVVYAKTFNSAYPTGGTSSTGGTVQINSGTASSIASAYVSQSVTQAIVANPNLPTYSFVGWYSDSTCTTLVSSLDLYSFAMPTSSTTRYAKFAIYVTLEYDGNGADSGTMSSQTLYYTQIFTLPSSSFVKLGYHFSYWNTASDGSGSNYNVGGGYTASYSLIQILYVKWAPDTYSVVLDAQGGSGGTTVTVTYDADMPTAAMPVLSGYTFGGYYTGTSGTGTQYYDASMNSTIPWNQPSGDTLYAKWT